MKIVILSPAKEEILQSTLFYLDHSPKAALRFEEELDDAWRTLQKRPNSYRVHSGNIRVRELDRFPFSIYYRVVGDEVHVLSVAHQARKPDFWIDR